MGYFIEIKQLFEIFECYVVRYSLENQNLILFGVLSKVGFSFHTRTYYYFSEFYLIIFNLLFVIMATMDITKSGFQTPASKKRKASGSPSLPPASQPATPPT